jgi:hypothetical protein
MVGKRSRSESILRIFFLMDESCMPVVLNLSIYRYPSSLPSLRESESGFSDNEVVTALYRTVPTYCSE